MPAALVQQAAIEIITLSQPHALVQQAVIEIMTLPNTAVNTQPFSVILRGVKRFKTGPKEFVCNPVDEEKHASMVDELTKWIG